MAAQKKGPAEAATSPSRGSNNPRKGNAVNRQHDTIAPQAPAMPDFKAAFDSLNDPISIVLRRSRTLGFFIDGIEDRLGGKDETHLQFGEIEAVWSLMQDLREAAEGLDREWERTNAARCQYERAVTLGYSDLNAILGNRDPLLSLVRSYEAGMAAYNGRTDEGEEAVRATYGPAFDALMDEAVPQPTTMEGAVAALRLLVKEGEVILDGQMASTVLPAVLGFLEREAA